MAGEIGLLDEITRFGHPWHGLWRASTPTTIVSPHGPTIPLPGLAPEGGRFGDIGTCYRLQMPGMPAVTDSADDIAAGRSWLNYAMVSGQNGRLYGKLGFIPWVDDNGDLWRLLITPTLGFIGTVGTLSIDVTISRFGQLGQPAESQALATLSASFDIFVGVSSYVSPTAWVEDVRHDGRGILLYVAGGTSDQPRVCMAILELTIAGVPPSAVGTLTTVVDTVDGYSTSSSLTSSWDVGVWDAINSVWQRTSTTSNPSSGIFAPTANALARTETRLIGARYNDTTIEAITSFYSQIATATGSLSTTNGSSAYSGDASSTHTQIWELRANGTPILTKSLAVVATYTMSGDALNPAAHADSVSATWSSDGASGTAPSNITFAGVMGEPTYTDPVIGAASDRQVGALNGVRYSNAVYGLYGVSRATPFVGVAEPIFDGVVGKIGSDPSRLLGSSFDTGPRYATEHPVTGQIVRDTVGVCWV